MASTSHPRHTPAVSTLTLLALFASVANAGLNAMTYKGCFSSSTPLADQGSYQYQTSGYCQPICVNSNDAVLATTNGTNCYCGNQLPAASSLVDDAHCNSPCNGYGSQNCGGQGYWSVYLSGTTNEVSNYGGSAEASTTAAAVATASPDSASTSTTAAPSVVTSVAPGTTIVVTIPASQAASTSSSTSNSNSGSSGSNVAGVAAGVVVGVLALAGIGLATFFLLRRRRRRAAEEDYKRSAQVSDFMRGSERKPPTTGYSNMSDSRLDPEAGRRNSAGSIADGQDYSRRILRVANPDSH